MDGADASLMEVSPRAASWRRSRPWSRSSSIGRSSSGSGSGSGSIEYTSLRDVLEEEKECGGSGGDHHHHHGCGGGGGGGGGGAWRAGGSWGEYSCVDIHEFDASNIGIRNQLLKHAASAYLQSAVVVAAGRDEGCCLARLWRRVRLRGGGGGSGGAVAGAGRRGRGGRGRVLMRACSWQGCVDDMARSARRFATFLARRVNNIWPW